MQTASPPFTPEQMLDRVIAAHAIAAGHPAIGIGADIKPPYDALVRELVVLRVLADGTIYLGGDIQEAVDRYAARYEEAANA